MNVIPETRRVTNIAIYVVISSDVDVMICEVHDNKEKHAKDIQKIRVLVTKPNLRKDIIGFRFVVVVVEVVGLNLDE